MRVHACVGALRKAVASEKRGWMRGVSAWTAREAYGGGVRVRATSATHLFNPPRFCVAVGRGRVVLLRGAARAVDLPERLVRPAVCVRRLERPRGALPLALGPVVGVGCSPLRAVCRGRPGLGFELVVFVVIVVVMLVPGAPPAEVRFAWGGRERGKRVRRGAASLRRAVERHGCGIRGGVRVL